MTLVTHFLRSSVQFFPTWVLTLGSASEWFAFLIFFELGLENISIFLLKVPRKIIWRMGKSRLNGIYLSCWDLLWVVPLFFWKCCITLDFHFIFSVQGVYRCLPLGEVWSLSNISCSITVAHQTKCQWVRIYDFLFFLFSRIYDFLMVAVCLSSLQCWSLWSSFANCRGILWILNFMSSFTIVHCCKCHQVFALYARKNWRFPDPPNCSFLSFWNDFL